jgi:hypothetical protein
MAKIRLCAASRAVKTGPLRRTFSPARSVPAVQDISSELIRMVSMIYTSQNEKQETAFRFPVYMALAHVSLLSQIHSIFFFFKITKTTPMQTTDSSTGNQKFASGRLLTFIP